MLTGHRYIAVVHPILAHEVCKEEWVKVQLVVLIATAIVIDIPRYFEMELCVLDGDGVYLRETAFYSDPVYQALYKITLMLALRVVLPMLLTLAFTVGLTQAVVRSRRRVAALAAKKISIVDPSISSRRKSNYQAKSQQSDSLTISLIHIAVIMIFCISPGIAYAIYRQFIDATEQECPHPYGILQTIADMLLILNSATNFFIYYPTLEIFRRDCRRLLNL